MTLRAAHAELRGPIRNGVAAVQAFGQLLRSPKVGPRQLGRALPDVLQGAWELSRALGELPAVFEVVLPPPIGSAVTAALSTARDRTASFAALLEAHGDKPVEARRRLELEGAAIRLSRELEGALCTIDFAVAASSPRVVSLALGDLLRERKPPPALVLVPVVLDGPATLVVDVDPMLVTGLLDVATACLEPDAVRGAVRLEVRASEGRAVLRLHRIPRETMTPAPAPARPPLLHGRAAKTTPPAAAAPVAFSFPVRVRLAELEQLARAVVAHFGMTLSSEGGVVTLVI